MQLANGLSQQHISRIGGALSIVPNPPEDWLAAAWLKFKEAGLLPIIWHERVPTLRWFLEWAADKRNIIYAGLFHGDGESDVSLCGLGWCLSLTPLGEQFKADVGMAFFPEWQHDNIPAELAEMMIDDAFQCRNMVLMVGATPIKNPAATHFIHKVGFHRVGVIPNYTTWEGKLCDAVISSLTLEDWFTSRGEVE